MKVAVVASLREATGNLVTAKRIGSHLIDIAEKVEVLDASGLASEELMEYDAIVGIHAYRAGIHVVHASEMGWRGRFFLVLGGTDVNMLLSATGSKEKCDIVARAVGLACRIVAFSSEMSKKLVSAVREGYFPVVGSKEEVIEELESRVVVLSQSVDVEMDRSEEFVEFDAAFGLAGDEVPLILPCGLRMVKDPLRLMSVVASEEGRRRKLVLCIVGPELDADVAKAVHESVASCTSIRYHKAVSRSQILYWYTTETDRLILVNSSIAEGQPNAPLEAMALKIPVLLRNVPGNHSLIQHNETGLLWDTDEDFLKAVDLVLTDTDTKTRLTNNAKLHIDEHYNPALERSKWRALLEK